MKGIGMTLIIVGSLVACWSAVLDTAQVAWNYFVPALIAGAIGVAMARYGSHKEATDKDKLDSNIKDIDASLDEILERVHELKDEKKDIDVYDLPTLIEERLHEPINRFVEARESIIHVYGLNTYADAMSFFAAGERYINRVWSAAAEGYIDEAHTYIDKSVGQFDGARDKIAAAKNAGAKKAASTA